MNVTVYPEAEAWLFAPRRPEHVCMWSFGRYPPQADIGDDLLFRRDGVPVARSIVRAIYKPGERDCMQFDGSRKLTGWKLLWYQVDFEDLRPRKLPKVFGAPLTDRMTDAIEQIDGSGGRMRYPGHFDLGLLRALRTRCLIEFREGEVSLTPEGWRAAVRQVNPQRQMDMEHTHDRRFDPSPVCRICGCTENSGCAPSCCWVDDSLCSSCEPAVEEAAT